jgi:spore germination cell wall hydrolase CwlJ-like protein
MMADSRAARLLTSALIFSISTSGLAAAKGGASDEEFTCLAKAIYFEARGETEKGQRAVGRVVLNRVKSDAYPDAICDVVYQGSTRSTGCQFSFTCDGLSDVAEDKKAWREAKDVARELIACDPPCQVGPDFQGPLWTSTHYHADYVNPRWAKKLNRTGAIGRHIFYATA